MAKVCKKIVDVEAGSVSFEFSNGETVTVIANDLSKTVKARALLHGLSQKVGDSYSGADGIDAAVEAARATVKNLGEGDWNTVREGGAGPRSTVLLQSLIRVSGKTEEECAAVIAKQDEDGLKALRAHPEIKAAGCAIRAEKAAAAADKSDTPSVADLLK